MNYNDFLKQYKLGDKWEYCDDKNRILPRKPTRLEVMDDIIEMYDRCEKHDILYHNGSWDGCPFCGLVATIEDQLQEIQRLVRLGT